MYACMYVCVYAWLYVHMFSKTTTHLFSRTGIHTFECAMRVFRSGKSVRPYCDTFDSTQLFCSAQREYLTNCDLVKHPRKMSFKNQVGCYK